MKTLNDIAKEAYEIAHAKGFWEGAAADTAKKLLLIHSEVSEAAEEIRAPILGVSMLGYELADVLIRTLDLMHGLGLDTGALVKTKMDFNRTRQPMHGGKKF